MGVPTSDWINWCRLCARDDVVFKVRERDQDLVRIIRKCFDVKVGESNSTPLDSLYIVSLYYNILYRQMTFKEPELGSMLCEECYSVVGQMLTFSESVAKIQGLFELLRHSGQQDSQDVDDLRREYGLPPTCKQELEFLDMDDDKFSLVDELIFSDHFSDHSPTPTPTPSPEVQRKRGRNSTHSKVELEEPSIKLPTSPQTKSVGRRGNFTHRKSELEERPLSLPKTQPLPKVAVKPMRRPTILRPHKSQLKEDEEELALTDNDTTSPQPAKRKRGRPSHKPTPVEPKSTAKTKPLEKSPKGSVSPEDRERSQSPPVDEFTCKACKESFMSFMALRRHKHDMHGGPKRFVCDICGKGLKTFTSLVEHKLVHTDEKPCVCPVCNAAFKNKARLRVHSQTHGAPKFECEICGKMLQTRANLNKHKTVHTAERRFKCEVCGIGSKNSTALKIHLLSHTGLRPYVCKYCGKAFASNTNCRSHKWKKHPEQAAEEDESESTRVPVPTLEELRAM
ncbi:hypothetical protein KR084_009947 [Drosophila pseudotakahashii]|nr:hypothetical protein KR084_009947 [Drosophila pseudotakahashii]